MLLKCQVCDPTVTRKMRDDGVKPIKTINTKVDEYVKDEKNKYYHAGCYVQHLIKKKKMSEEEANSKLNERICTTKKELKELEQKDEFYQWIKNYYDASLPAYFCTKVAEIVKGTHERVNEPISYEILLDIYKTMAVYLHKNANRNNIKKTKDRMNYDLAVVIGNYGDYKKYKMKEKQDSLSKIDVENKINDAKRYQDMIGDRVKQSKNDNDFELLDVLEDLLL